MVKFKFTQPPLLFYSRHVEVPIASPDVPFNRKVNQSASSPIICFRYCMFVAWNLSVQRPIFALKDGVLLRGPDVLPAAKRALNILEGNNPYRKCAR